MKPDDTEPIQMGEAKNGLRPGVDAKGRLKEEEDNLVPDNSKH